MTTKEWLSRATNIDKEIGRLMEKREEALARCLSTTTCVDSLCVSGTKDPHKFDVLGEYDDEINRLIDKLCDVKREIKGAICLVDDSVLRELLMCKYIHGLSWEQVAQKIGKTKSMAKIKLHARALSAVETIIKHNI